METVELEEELCIYRYQVFLLTLMQPDLHLLTENMLMDIESYIMSCGGGGGGAVYEKCKC